MKDRIYYYDHKGALKLTLNEWPYYSEPSDLKNWSWGYNEQFGRFNTFRRDKKNWELVVGIAGGGAKAHDDLCDIFTADILAGEPGRLELRGWSLSCYIIEAEYAFGLDKDRQAVFSVLSTDSVWTRSTTMALSSGGDSGEIPEGDGRWRDYIQDRGYKPTDAKYGYNLVNAGSAFFPLTGVGNGYKIAIYGPVDNPIVYLDNHPIIVNVTVNQGEQLVITSNGSEKTIEIVQQDGSKNNVFNLRSKEYSPFIELGDSVTVTFGDIRMDFTTIERRSEPTWI